MSTLALDTFFHPIGFAVFAIWWVATLYCVSLCQRHPNIPVQYRPWYNLLVLFTGPWGMAVILARFRYPAHQAAAREYRDQVEGSPMIRWLRRLLGLYRPPVEQVTVIELCTADGKPLHQIDVRYGKKSRQEDSESLAHIKNLLVDAVEMRVTDLLIDPRSEEQYSIRFRVDGVLEERERVGADMAHNMLNCLKIASKMDIAERRRAQDGSFMIKLPQLPINCRLATAGTLRGPKAAVRILDRRIGLKPVTSLGLRRTDMERLMLAANRKSGMILVCGPTGSGKTTTLYAVLNQFDAQSRNIVTVEDPIEYPVEHATQTEVNEKAGITFANALRAMLRQNPDVILVGEVRDNETADLALQASNTGHLVLTTVHGNDSSAAMLRLSDLGIPARRLAGAVTAVLSQRLVRKLCPHCKTRTQLNNTQYEIGRKHGLTSDIVFKNVGCDKCRETGFAGRKGIFELLFVDRKVNDVLASEPSLSELRDAAIEAGMVPMFDHGMQQVAAGIATFDEIQRVCDFD